MFLTRLYKLAAGSILEYKNYTSTIPVLISIFLGLCYLILPVYIFVPALLLCGIIILGLIKPEYTFYILVFVLVEEMCNCFINLKQVYVIVIYPYYIPLLATVPGIIVRKIARKEPLVHTPIAFVLWGIVGGEIVSLLWAPVFSLGVWFSVNIVSNIFLYYVVTNIVVNKKILRRTVNVFIFAGIVTTTAIMFSQWYDVKHTIFLNTNTGFQYAFGEQVDRPAGLGGVDHVAGFVSIALFMSLGSMVYESRWKVKAIYFLLIGYSIYGIILTASRGVLIGICSAYLFFVFVHSNFRGKFLRQTFRAFFLVFFIILVAKPGLIDRMLIGFGYTGTLYFSEKDSYHGTEATTSSGEGLSGMEMRIIWWKNALREMTRHPVKMFLGLGTGGFIYYSQGGNTVTSPEVNSISFAFFYDMGIFGIILLILLLYLIVSNFHYCIKNAKKATKGYSYYIFLGSMAVLVSEIVIHGLVDYDLNSYGSKYFWFPLGYAMAVLNIVNAETNDGKIT